MDDSERSRAEEREKEEREEQRKWIVSSLSRKREWSAHPAGNGRTN